MYSMHPITLKVTEFFEVLTIFTLHALQFKVVSILLDRWSTGRLAAEAVHEAWAALHRPCGEASSELLPEDLRQKHGPTNGWNMGPKWRQEMVATHQRRPFVAIILRLKKLIIWSMNTRNKATMPKRSTKQLKFDFPACAWKRN